MADLISNPGQPSSGYQPEGTEESTVDDVDLWDDDSWAGRFELTVLAPVFADEVEEKASLDAELQAIAEAALEQEAVTMYRLDGEGDGSN